MGLELNLVGVEFEPRGAPKKPLEFEIGREMTEADFVAIETVSIEMRPTELKRLSERHHMLARLLASGTKPEEISLILGYDQGRISAIKSSPAFQELLAVYRKEVDREFASVLQHMAGLGKDAILELRDRMEDDPSKFTTSELLKMTTELSDRAQAADDKLGPAPVVIELIAASVEKKSEAGEE